MGGTVLAENLRNREDPFQLTADPKFCYLDPARRHASARLLSGLYAGDGLFTLTGRAGIGKSILLRHLSEQLNGLDVVYPLTGLLVFSCRTGTALGDILGACESRLGLGESIAAPLKAAKRLQQLVEDARSPVLLLDDADLLGDDVLEAIVTLSGLQSSDRSLLSIVMAGHTSVVARLAAIAGASAGNSDRVVNLEPMMEADAARLIRHRLRVAEHPEGVFPNDAIARILRHSAGVPLNIVRVCRRAMQLAERRSLKSVTADLVAEAISEEFPGGSRESGRSPPGAPATQHEASHSRSLRPTPIMLAAASERPAEAHQLAITPPLADLRAVPPVAEPRAEVRAEPPPMRPDTSLASEPSLLREPHMSIPDVTLGRPTRARSGERTTRDYADGRRRRNGRRVKFTLAGGGLLLVLLAAGLIALMGSTRPLGDASRTSATAGLQSGSASPADQTQEGWWQPPTTVTSRAPGESDFGIAGTGGHYPLPGLASVDVGRMPDPIASDAVIGAGRSDSRANSSEGASMSTGANAPIAPETVSPSIGKETRADEPAASTRTETASRSAAVAPIAPVTPTKVEPQPKPAAQAAKPAGPQAKSTPMQAKAPPPVRNREIDNLLAEGDARLAEGDLEAARSAYELAYDKGSRIAALRMAQTFDPRTAPGMKKSASPAEAILWYQDAARKGDRGAREELDNLATWLENDAASGSAEARRVLDLWRTPAEPADSLAEPTQ
jgi:type II secretory pathway predicted ATPase ExeA